jgi:hypothetical protein
MTYEGVALCTLAQLMGQARGRLLTWRHVDLSRAKSYGATESR